MPFRGMNAVAESKPEYTGTPNWLGFQQVAITDVLDRSDEFNNLDMFLEIHFKNGNSDYPYKYSLLGTFDKDAQGNITGESGLLKRIVYLCDALGWAGGVNKQGQWVDEEDKEIKDIAGYLNLNFSAANYGLKGDDVDHEKYYIYVYKKFNAKSNKAYTTVCPKIAKVDKKSKADLESYVDWMKANKFIVEHDENAQQKPVSNGTATSEAFDKF